MTTLDLIKNQADHPHIAASVSDRELEIIDSAVLKAIDLIELRIDHFTSISTGHIAGVIRKARSLNRHLICTVRSPDEGGRISITDEERLEIFGVAAPLVDIIDIEASSAIFRDVLDMVNKNNKILIASVHNFNCTPPYREMEEMIRFNKARGAHIVKIATMPQRREDILEMTRLTVMHHRDNIVTISMGQMGMITRLFFPFIGSLFTFASVGSTKAPGQIDAIRLREIMEIFSSQKLHLHP